MHVSLHVIQARVGLQGHAAEMCSSLANYFCNHSEKKAPGGKKEVGKKEGRRMRLFSLSAGRNLEGECSRGRTTAVSG